MSEERGGEKEGETVHRLVFTLPFLFFFSLDFPLLYFFSPDFLAQHKITPYCQNCRLVGDSGTVLRREVRGSDERTGEGRMSKKLIYSVFIPVLLLVAETPVESWAQHVTVTLPDGQ